MKKSIYLLALDCTSDSKAAAQVAWMLAGRTGATVIGQHVINLRDVWRFLKQAVTCPINTDTYTEAFEHVMAGLRTIANELVGLYKKEAPENISFTTIIDEGDVTSQVWKRAQEADLLIIGHRNHEQGASNTTISTSALEDLVAGCPCPVLIVTSEQADISKLYVHISASELSQSELDRLDKFIKALKLSPEIAFDENVPAASINALTNQLIQLGMAKNNIHCHNGKFLEKDELLAVVTEETPDKKANLTNYLNRTRQANVLIWR